MLALLRGVVGQAELDLISFVCADHGVGDAGVAAGGIEDDFAGGELAGALAFQDHVEGGAVLDGAAGIEKLGLGVDLDAGEVGGDAVEADEGGVADQAEQVRSAGAGGGGCGERHGSDLIICMSVENRTFACRHGTWMQRSGGGFKGLRGREGGDWVRSVIWRCEAGAGWADRRVLGSF